VYPSLKVAPKTFTPPAGRTIDSALTTDEDSTTATSITNVPIVIEALLIVSPKAGEVILYITILRHYKSLLFILIFDGDITLPNNYNEVLKMVLSGIGKVHEPAKGRVMIYIPADVHKDSTFPFKSKENVQVSIEKGRLIIEKVPSK
jgi:hypothetical protein